MSALFLILIYWSPFAVTWSDTGLIGQFFRTGNEVNSVVIDGFISCIVNDVGSEN